MFGLFYFELDEIRKGLWGRTRLRVHVLEMFLSAAGR